MASYLVTGGAGFIGSHIVEALLSLRHEVRVLDNFSTGQRDNLNDLDAAEVIDGDVRSYHIVRAVMDGIDVVLHQAALPSVPRSVHDPITSNDVNVTGTLNVLTAARDAGVGRLVLASSSSVYGTNAELPKRENMPPSPLSPYAVSKLAGESYCRAFTQIYGFETVVLRYFNVFGPRQNPDSQYAAVIPRFVDALLRNRPPVIFGDGSQTRDFTFVANVVAANLAASEREGVAGRTFNVATGRAVSLLELTRLMAGILHSPIQPVFEPTRAGDVPHSLADISAAKEGLGYEPQVGLREGLERTVRFMAGADVRLRRTAA